MSAHVSSNDNYVVADILILCRTIQTAVLIETLTALGAQVTWSSCVRIEVYGIITGY